MAESSGRDIEWTGERCVPWSPDIQVIYEHYHRYAIARDLARGKRVLDLGCGEGYGSALLAEVAREVVGVDIDEAAVEHARRTYSAPNLTFESGSMVNTSLLSDEAEFDVVVCFDAIEHVDDHEAVMKLARGRLAADGVLLLSSPDSAVYRHDHGNENPFHVHELTAEDLKSLLARTFTHHTLMYQSLVTGSAIFGDAPNGDFSGYTLLANEHGADWALRPGLPHTYLFAIASDQPIDADLAGSVLIDPSQALVNSGDLAVQRDRVHALYRDSRAEVESLKQTISQLESLRKSEADRADAATAELDRLATELHLQRRAAERESATVEWLRETIAASGRRAGEAEREVTELRAKTREISPPVQRALSKYRQTIERMAPRGTMRRSAYEVALGRSAETVAAAAGPVTTPPIRILTSPYPLVSVIIPVHNKWAYTEACLRSIASSLVAVPFEVIVVDDASTDETNVKLAAYAGIRSVTCEKNIGFVGACNLGAAQAKASLLMFLNNDTEIRPGTIEELVQTANSDDRIGLVGSMLVYPDGRLQESGGIIWSDGSGWNYGRNGDPQDPRMTVLRDVDYVSGASILVRRDLFEQVGGFDVRYSPAYYEDTDLAFAIRKSGHRVLVQPKSVVVHHEGVSNGTELTSGIKRYQELNRTVFVEKWATELLDQLPGPSEANLWLARQRDPFGGSGPLVVVVDHQVPTPTLDSGSVRMFEIIRVLIGQGCRVVFLASNGQRPHPETEHLEQLGATVLTGWDQQIQFISEAGSEISLALLSRPQVAWRFLEDLRRHAPKAVIAYDTVDVHFLRLQRQADLAATQNLPDEAAAWRRIARTSKELELGLTRICDITFVVSEVERTLLQELVPDADVRVLSNIHEVDWTKATLQGRGGVVFVGSYDHLPNRDAAIWLATEIMPLVREQIPDALLHIVGSHPTEEILALAGPGVKVHGFVTDLAPIYAQARVATAPLRFGAGVKGKIGESVSNSVPTVGTAMAVEGMHLVADEDVLVAESAEDFAKQVLRLLTDDELWYQLSESAKAKIAEQFGPQSARTALAGVLGLPA
ncbi:MAG: glycosyl transferase family 2 [Frankiales bacterium]|nr:glycosyl transferase family 2 [Frankiales bacterium]